MFNIFVVYIYPLSFIIGSLYYILFENPEEKFLIIALAFLTGSSINLGIGIGKAFIEEQQRREKHDKD